MNRILVLASLSLLALGGVACTGTSGAKGGGAALGMAVINSDFKSTSVSLVDPNSGKLTQDDCIDSGSVTSTLSMALSGDVVLPSSTQVGDPLLLLDRMNSALAWVAPGTCKVMRQISVGTGFYANPHDVVSLSESKAYVTRFETNVSPGAMANDGGDDILIIDPTTGAINGRIDLSSYATDVSGYTIEARPDRALFVDGKVYVSLGNMTQDFMTTGAGRVVVLDPSTNGVLGTIELPMYKDCSQLDFISSSNTLVIGCGGDSSAALSDQVAQSAIVLVDISGATPVVKKSIGASATGGRPISSAFAVAGDNLIVAATYGDYMGPAVDALWALQLDSGKATKIADGDGSFVFGGVSWSAPNHLVYVTDAGTTNPTVRIFDVSNPSAVKARSSFVSNPKSGLPPRQIGWY